MHTLIVLVAVISAVSSCGFEHHFPSRSRQRHRFLSNRHPHFGIMQHFHDRLFNDIARDLKALDDKIENSCSRHSNSLTREVIETGRYKITAPITGFSVADFEVKIKGRVIYVSAKNGDSTYTEVRTLPTFVEVAKGSYSYDEGILNVVFPINNEASICNLGYGENEITVPKFDLIITGMDRRFGDDTPVV